MVANFLSNQHFMIQWKACLKGESQKSYLSKEDENMVLVPNPNFMRINTKSLQTS